MPSYLSADIPALVSHDHQPCCTFCNHTIYKQHLRYFPKHKLRHEYQSINPSMMQRMQAWVPLYPYLEFLNVTSNYLELVFTYKLWSISDSGKFSCIMKHNILTWSDQKVSRWFLNIFIIESTLTRKSGKLFQVYIILDKNIFSNFMIKTVIKQLERISSCNTWSSKL